MDQDSMISQAVGPADNGIVLRVKVVPGAKRNKVVGMLGDRLKLAVAAPPEAGKANKAVCKLIAKALDVPARDVTVSSGTSQPMKTLRVQGISIKQAIERLVSADAR